MNCSMRFGYSEAPERVCYQEDTKIMEKHAGFLS
jgi:hypothetical protein